MTHSGVCKSILSEEIMEVNFIKAEKWLRLSVCFPCGISAQEVRSEPQSNSRTSSDQPLAMETKNIFNLNSVFPSESVWCWSAVGAGSSGNLRLHSQWFSEKSTELNSFLWWEFQAELYSVSSNNYLKKVMNEVICHVWVKHVTVSGKEKLFFQPAAHSSTYTRRKLFYWAFLKKQNTKYTNVLILL